MVLTSTYCLRTEERSRRVEADQQDAGELSVRLRVLLARLAPGQPHLLHRERRRAQAAPDEPGELKIRCCASSRWLGARHRVSRAQFIRESSHRLRSITLNVTN